MRTDLDRMKIPEHIAIIMDGNGRWAKRHGVARSKGHEQGGKTVQRVIDFCLEKGVKWLTLYAFSTENWGRSKIEVNYLMRMLNKYLIERCSEMQQKGVRLRAIGELHMLPDYCRKTLDQCVADTAQNDKINLVLALSYGSRQEIAAAARRLAERVLCAELKPEDITPELLGNHLYTAGIPDPDLLIRTSGEMRLSNFLLWQISYSELIVMDVLWPDFDRTHFDDALSIYASRERRFGKR